ncbi:hypothetical protein ABI59_03330 [Acidobacteria bacterium Mor1]|nr:hypothetical protein ABI59_03330 [Acidobacteria bacterium Mor1]
MDDERRKSEAGGEPLDRYLREISRLPRVTPEEERELGRRIQNGDKAALEKLVEANLRFVVSYAKRYRGCGLAFLDLINEGNVGLIEAAKRYDPDKKVKFITYAVWWVRQSMIHAISDQSGSFRLPQKQANLLYRIGKAQAQMSIELRRSPTVDEIAGRVKAESEDVSNLLQLARESVSLSDSGDDSDYNLADKIAQDLIPDADRSLVKAGLGTDIDSALAELNPNQAKVVRLRFGLDGEDPKTLQEVGEILGLSRERIRQIEADALHKLNRSQRSQNLRGYLN